MDKEAGKSQLAVTIEWDVTKLDVGKLPPVTRYVISDQNSNSVKSVMESCEKAKQGVNEILTHVVEKNEWPSLLPENIAPVCPHGFPYTNLECRYSPSHWTKNGMDPNQVITKYVKKMLAYPPADLLANVGGELDLPYGDGVDEKVDIYGSNVLPAAAPVFAFVHGGYWQEGSRKQATVMVENLSRQGVITAVIGYDLTPTVSLETMVKQMVKATGFLNDWCTRRGSRGLYLCGHSAGALLLATAVMTDASNLDQVKGIFLLSGIYDLVPLIGTYIDRAMGLTPAMAKRLSPVHLIPDLSESTRQVLSEINIHIAVGGNESIAFHEQSKHFFDSLTNLRLLIDPGYHVIEEEDHFSLIECLDNPDSAMCKMLCRWLGLAVG